MARRSNPKTTDPDEPIGYYELESGTPVVVRDGEQVGTVHSVGVHERERLLDGIVVQASDGRRFVDAPEVTTITRSRVEIDYSVEEFLALPSAGGPMAFLDRSLRRIRRRRPETR